MNRNNKKHSLFLQSALSVANPYNSTEDILLWLNRRNKKVSVKLEQLKLEKIKKWYFCKDTGNLKHESGNFFSIEGINVQTNWGGISEWSQPIINQPEIGFLGFITKEFNGMLYFLVQAKIEPGNVNNVQLSPTLQATKSNYTQVHGGKKPTYLEYFQDRVNNEVLLDQFQSEQGARFLKKRNRNIIIKVSSVIPVYEDFKWVTLGQLKELIQHDNKVNMDTRTVISGIPYGSYRSEVVDFYNITSQQGKTNINSKMLHSELDDEKSIYSIDDIISWFTQLKSHYELELSRIPLNSVKDWEKTDYELKHKKNKFFKVIGVNVEISNREVQSWQQPIIKPAEEGLCAFIVKEIEGIYHFLIQAKLEAGNFDILEMAPTVQCLTGNYKNEKSLSSLPFLDFVLNSNKKNIIFDTLQSEEGGRFYQEQNRNMILIVEEDFNIRVPENYIWMTLNQIKSFIRYNNYFNIQSRSLISAISFID